MNQITFKNVVNNLDDMISKGEHVSQQFHDGVGGEAIIGEARELQGKMDRVMQSELCHLIGMGDLTVSQNIQLVNRIKLLGEYRPVVKTVASLPQTNYKMSDIKESTYNSILTGTVLRGGKE